MLEIYKNIKKYRVMNGWSQDELAKKVGYNDRSTIARIERGDIDLPQSKILQFADVFKISASELMGNDGIVNDDDMPPSIRAAARQIMKLQPNDQDFIINVINSYSETRGSDSK